MPDEQTHIFKVFAQTKPGERVLMRSHTPGGRPMSTLFLQQGTGIDSDWWVSEEVLLEVGRTVNYGYVIRAEAGVDTLEAQRRSLSVKRSETRVKMIADGAFKSKVPTSDATVTKKESSGTPAGSAPVLAQEEVTTGKLSDPEPSLALVGALEKCEQLEQQLACLERLLLAEIKAIFEEISGKVENMENRISANADVNAELERTQAELKREFVTTGRVDEISREVGSSLRGISKQFEAVGLTLKDHTSRLADTEKEAGRGKEEVGALWEHVRQAGSSCQTEVAGVRVEHGARIDALELALRQRAECAKSGVQDEVRALHEQQQQEMREEFRLLKEWQKANKDELKGSLEAMVERQRKTSQRAAELSQQVEDLEKALQDHTGSLAAVELEARRSKEEVGALWEHLRQASAARQADVAGLRDEQGTRLDTLDLAMRQHAEMTQGLKSQWQATLAKSGVQDEVRALGEKFRDFEEWQKVDKGELKELKGSLKTMAETQRKTSQEAAKLSQQIEELKKAQRPHEESLAGQRDLAERLGHLRGQADLFHYEVDALRQGFRDTGGEMSSRLTRLEKQHSSSLSDLNFLKRSVSDLLDRAGRTPELSSP